MPNWLQILIFVLAFGSPVISWLFSQLKQKADEKRERARLQRLREEELRTGRRLIDEQPTALVPAKNDRATELQRLAERRQQQLRELRQRQAQQQGQAAPSSATAQLQSQPKNLPNRSQSRAEQARQRMQDRLQQRQEELKKRQESLQQRRQQQSNRPTTGQPTAQPQRSGAPIARNQDAEQIKAALARSAQAAALDQASIQQQMRESPVSAARQGGAMLPMRRQSSLGTEVRDLLRGSSKRRADRPSLASLLAVSEVLAKPVSMRDSEGEGGVTL